MTKIILTQNIDKYNFVLQGLDLHLLISNFCLFY